MFRYTLLIYYCVALTHSSGTIVRHRGRSYKEADENALAYVTTTGDWFEMFMSDKNKKIMDKLALKRSRRSPVKLEDTQAFVKRFATMPKCAHGVMVDFASTSTKLPSPSLVDWLKIVCPNDDISHFSIVSWYRVVVLGKLDRPMFHVESGLMIATRSHFEGILEVISHTEGLSDDHSIILDILKRNRHIGSDALYSKYIAAGGTMDGFTVMRLKRRATTGMDISKCAYTEMKKLHETKSVPNTTWRAFVGSKCPSKNIPTETILQEWFDKVVSRDILPLSYRKNIVSLPYPQYREMLHLILS